MSTGLKQRFIGAAFWSVLGSVIGRGSMLVGMIIVARILGKAQYGEFSIIRSTINLFIVASGMGIGYTASKYISQYRNTDPARAGSIYRLSNLLSLFFAAVCSIILIVLSPFIATEYLLYPHLSPILKIGSLVIFFTTINGIQSGALSGFEDFKSNAVNIIISGTVQFILIISLTYFYGMTGAVVALGLGSAILAILNYYSINQKLKEHSISTSLKNLTKDIFSILYKFTIPAFLSSFLVVPVIWLAKTRLVNNCGYLEMADFDVAEQWHTMILFIPSCLSQIILPFLSNILSSGNRSNYVTLIKVNIILNFVISSIISLVIMLFAKPILSLYGKEFMETMPIYIMMITAILISVCNVVGQVIASQDKMWMGFLFNGIWAIILLFSSYIFIDKGAVGLSYSFLISYAVHFILQTLYVSKSIKQYKKI